MPPVDFYVVKGESEKAQLLFACRLADKTYQAQQHLYIHCHDKNQAITIDDMLWRFNDISFIPHGLMSRNEEITLPILIGYGNDVEVTCDIILNLDREIPMTVKKFKRIIEIVYQDPEAKKIARTHYKIYQDKQFPLKSHHLN